MRTSALKMRVLVALATALPLSAGQNSDYDRGIGLVREGRFAEALPYLGRAVKAKPDDATGWKALGVAFAAQQHYELAEPAFGRACQMDPKLQDACYYHGRALYALDRYDASLQVLERESVAQPKSWKVRLGIAEALEALGKAAAAESAFRKALDLVNNNDPQPSVAYSLFLVRQGRTPDAVPVLERVLKRFPDSGAAQTQFGRALLEQGSVAKAITHLERAVALEPDSAQAHVLLAKAYTRAGRSAEAQAQYDAAERCEQSSRR